MSVLTAFISGVTRLNDFVGRWIALLVFAMFAFLLLEVGFRYLLNAPTVSSWEPTYSAWNPPVWPVKLAIPVGTGLLALQGLAKLLEDIAIAFNLDYYRPDQSISEGEQS